MSYWSKRKRRKELKFKRKMRKFSNHMRSSINKLTKSIASMVKEAAYAKESGLMTHYKKAINNIHFAMNARAKYVVLQMDLDMALQMRDSMNIIKGFSESMKMWGKSISKITKNFDVEGVISNVENAADLISEKNEELEELTEAMSTNFDDIISDDQMQYVSCNDVEKFVDNYIVNNPKINSGKTERVNEIDIETIRKMLDGESKND